MEFDWVGIEKLSISAELKKAGYRHPTGADITTISKIGPITPCVVRRASMPGDYQILANAYIWLGVQQAGQYQVPISIVEPIDQSEIEIYTSSDSGESPIDRAGRFQSWLSENTEATVEDLARIENTTRSNIAHTIRLLNLDPDIRSLISIGKLSAAHGKELLKIKKTSIRLKFADAAVTGQWSVRHLKLKISGDQYMALSSAVKDPNIVKEENLLTERVGSPVSIDYESGLVIIDYRKNLEVYGDIRKKLLASLV